MEIIGPDQSVPFVQQVDTDAAYPSRIGEPSVDGPVIYPAPEPDVPQNVVPFTRETGLDPSKIPSLRDKLKVLEGGKQDSTAIVPSGRIENRTNPTTMTRLGADPVATEEFDIKSLFTGKSLAVVAVVGLVGYFIGRATGGGSEPLIADLSDEE